MIKNKIYLGNGTYLTVGRNYDNNEFCVFIEKDGLILQDLARVRKEKEGYEVLVYANEKDGDYTHKFHIKEYVLKD